MFDLEDRHVAKANLNAILGIATDCCSAACGAGAHGLASRELASAVSVAAVWRCTVATLIGLSDDSGRWLGWLSRLGWFWWWWIVWSCKHA